MSDAFHGNTTKKKNKPKQGEKKSGTFVALTGYLSLITWLQGLIWRFFILLVVPSICRVLLLLCGLCCCTKLVAQWASEENLKMSEFSPPPPSFSADGTLTRSAQMMWYHSFDNQFFRFFEGQKCLSKALQTCSNQNRASLRKTWIAPQNIRRAGSFGGVNNWYFQLWNA